MYDLYHNQKKEIEELKEKQTAFKEFKEELKPLIKNEFIHKDKIREKLEECKEELENNKDNKMYMKMIYTSNEVIREEMQFLEELLEESE